MPRKQEVFQASETEAEEFEGSVANQVWPLEGVVGEDVDVFGTSRYEIRWREWRRKDGSSTTWDKNLEDNPEIIKDWTEALTEQRVQQAHNSTSVRLLPLSLATINERHTAELSEARIEKRKRRDSQKSQRVYDDPYTKWDEVVRLDAAPNELQRTKTAWQDATNSHNKGQALQPTRRSPRKVLQGQWDEATKQAKAAPVTIVSDNGDADVIPALPQGFKFLESGYANMEEITHANWKNALLGCDCDGICTSAELCNCQVITDDLEQERSFAYTSQRTVRDDFGRGPNRGHLIVECNPNCKCSGECPNRVAQTARQVPLEVFETQLRGWGVRATSDLKSGAVIGCFAGCLITSDMADEEARAGRDQYMFSLDALVGEGGTAKFCVNAFHYGNWTRFINHSCVPNLRVLPVIYGELIPTRDLEIYYLTFVTTGRIPKGTELTIDYDPLGAEKMRTSKGKGKAGPASTDDDQNIMDCKCGEQDCRGKVRAVF